MSVTLSLSEARATLPHVLDLVESGEEVTITRHGKPVAVMVTPLRLANPRAAGVLEEAARIGRFLDEAARRPVTRRVLPPEGLEEHLQWVEEGRREDEEIPDFDTPDLARG